jgi:hypothetical protein
LNASINEIDLIIAKLISKDEESAKYVISKIPQFLTSTKSEKTLMDILLNDIEKYSPTTIQGIIDIIWANKDSWIKEKNVKKVFITKLIKLKKSISNQTLKDRIQAIQDEITPPEVSNRSLPEKN